MRHATINVRVNVRHASTKRIRTIPRDDYEYYSPPIWRDCSTHGDCSMLIGLYCIQHVLNTDTEIATGH